MVMCLAGPDPNSSIYCGTLRLDESIEGEASMVKARKESENKRESGKR